MKTVCVFLVVLVAAFTRADDPTVITAKGTGDGGVLELNGFKSVGLACADSTGKEVAKVGCGGGDFTEVSADDIDADQYEFSIKLTCKGDESSLSECQKGEPAGAKRTCTTYVGCASKRRAVL